MHSQLFVCAVLSTHAHAHTHNPSYQVHLCMVNDDEVHHSKGTIVLDIATLQCDLHHGEGSISTGHRASGSMIYHASDDQLDPEDDCVRQRNSLPVCV